MMIETAYSELQNECLIDKTTADKVMSSWNGLEATNWSYKKYCFHKKCVKTHTMIEAAYLKPKNECLIDKTTDDKVTSWWNIMAPKNWRQKEYLVFINNVSRHRWWQKQHILSFRMSWQNYSRQSDELMSWWVDETAWQQLGEVTTIV